jgi:hypothetical protein
MILRLQDGTEVRACAALAADGRNSTLRDAIGIKVKTWSYPQSALVMNFSHRLGHGDVSTEFHTEQGPFTQVPLPGNRSSLVWAVKPDEVDAILALPRKELNAEVERRMHSILGAVEVENDPQAWPLSSLIANSFGAGRTMLVGETGHAFPPIGAQGLNLGLRDITQAIDALQGSGRPRAGAARCRELQPEATAGCHQPHRRGGSAQQGAAEFVSSDAGPARRRPCRAVIDSAAQTAGDARGHDARMAQKRPEGLDVREMRAGSQPGNRSGGNVPLVIIHKSADTVATLLTVVTRTVADARSTQVEYCWAITNTLVAVGSEARSTAV